VISENATMQLVRMFEGGTVAEWSKAVLKRGNISGNQKVSGYIIASEYKKL